MVNIEGSQSLEIKVIGVNLGNVTIEIIKKLNINLKYFVALGADGCSVNTSEVCGDVTIIQKEATNAVYSACRNHNLNLSISK